MAKNWQARTEQWRDENPIAWEKLQEFALEAAKHGKFGVDLIVARLRWEVHLQMNLFSDETYKINNNMRSHLARKLIRTYPHLADKIALRKLRSPQSNMIHSGELEYVHG